MLPDSLHQLTTSLAELNLASSFLPLFPLAFPFPFPFFPTPTPPTDPLSTSSTLTNTPYASLSLLVSADSLPPPALRRREGRVRAFFPAPAPWEGSGVPLRVVVRDLTAGDEGKGARGGELEEGGGGGGFSFLWCKSLRAR